ncbi:MAG: WD40 repeat domain-containing protein [Planctomycetes bacterium]|nr:WD40 repeat domain-containing protein [Planctomycetota bacterium]
MGRLERIRKLVRLPHVKRFSLRSLLLCVLLIGSAACLWLNWGPWVPAFRFEMGEGDVFPEYFVPPYDRESDTFWGVTTGGDLLVWNGSSGACALRKRIGEGKAFLGYKLPGEIYLYLLNEKSMVANVIDLREKAFVIEFTLPNGKEAVSAIQSMDGQWLACGSDGNVVQIRRVADWTVKYQIPKRVNRFYRIEFSSDSRRIKVAPPEETQYWDLESGTRVWVGASSNEALTSQNFRRYLDFPEGSPPVIRAIPDNQPFIVIKDPDATKVRGWDWVGDSVLLAFQSSRKDSALVIDAANGEVVTRIESTVGEVESIVLPNGTALALVVNSNGEAWVVKLPSGELKWRFSSAGQEIVRVGIIHTFAHAYTVDKLGMVCSVENKGRSRARIMRL